VATAVKEIGRFSMTAPATSLPTLARNFSRADSAGVFREVEQARHLTLGQSGDPLAIPVQLPGRV
jgi:hypothetical protein